MRTRQLFMSIVALCLFAVPAMADPTFGDGAVGLQTVFDDITVGGSSSVSALNDAIVDSQDSTWSITASGGSIATLIIEVASWANTNTFGVYDPISGQYVELFSGAQGAGAQVSLTIKNDGSVFKNIVNDTGIDFASKYFGYYVESTPTAGWTGGTWHSDSTKNADQADHMGAYQGTGDDVQLPGLNVGEWTDNEYILAFEDLHSQHWGTGAGPTWGNGSEPDYTDMVLMVESVQVPVPGALLLGMVGLSAAALRLRKKRA